MAVAADFLAEIAAGITGFIATHQALAVPALVLLMMAEALPLIGFLVPGAFILPLIGMLSGSGNFSFINLYLIAVAGSLSGDFLGYWFGRKGGHEWQPALLQSRHRHVLKLAHDMVSRHGGIAVFLGRFVWLIHPAIPMAAGLLGVRLRTFLLFDALAVCLWVFLYLGAGHVITGRVLSALHSDRGEEIILPVLAVLLAIAVLYAVHRKIGRLS